jgi:hypothetical protein
MCKTSPYFRNHGIIKQYRLIPIQGFYRSSRHMPVSSPILFSNCPRRATIYVLFSYDQFCDSNCKDDPRHQKRNESHCDCVDKHGVKIVPLYRFNSVLGLHNLAWGFSFNNERLTLAINMNPPAIKQKAVINSEGGLLGSRDVGGAK